MACRNEGEQVEAVSRPDCETRARRAELLAGLHASSAAILRFYAGLTRAQARVRDPSDYPMLLSYIEEAGTADLRQRASELRSGGTEIQQALLETYRRGEALDEGQIFFARVFLQPLVERGDIPCDHCGRSPHVAVLRPAFDGARRTLVCGMCQREWDYRRILCPRCGEEAFEALPVFSFEQFDYIQVNACEHCKGYLLCVDAGKRPEAVPVVDELAAVPLNLWATEKGYEKIEKNLMGL